MKKKRISLNTIKNQFKAKPLFDDSDIYRDEIVKDDISIEQLDDEIDKLVKEMKNNK